MPTFSTIIPTLNEAGNVSRAVASAWAAGTSEVIVADGGSSDSTRILAQQAGAQVMLAPQGRALQQNAAAAHARGEWLLFLHADTRLDENAAAQLLPLLKQSHLHVAAFRQRIQAAGLPYRWLERGNAWRARRGTAYGDQGIVVRRSVFESVGGFPAVPIMEDLRLMRLLKPYGPLQLLEGPLHVSARRWQARGVLQQTARNWLMVAAERCGVSPSRLIHWYQPHSPDLSRPLQELSSN